MGQPSHCANAAESAADRNRAHMAAGSSSAKTPNAPSRRPSSSGRPAPSKKPAACASSKNANSERADSSFFTAGSDNSRSFRAAGIDAGAAPSRSARRASLRRAACGGSSNSQRSFTTTSMAKRRGSRASSHWSTAASDDAALRQRRVSHAPSAHPAVTSTRVRESASHRSAAARSGLSTGAQDAKRGGGRSVERTLATKSRAVDARTSTPRHEPSTRWAVAVRCAFDDATRSWNATAGASRASGVRHHSTKYVLPDASVRERRSASAINASPSESSGARCSHASGAAPECMKRSTTSPTEPFGGGGPNRHATVRSTASLEASGRLFCRRNSFNASAANSDAGEWSDSFFNGNASYVTAPSRSANNTRTSPGVVSAPPARRTSSAVETLAGGGASSDPSSRRPGCGASTTASTRRVAQRCTGPPARLRAASVSERSCLGAMGNGASSDRGS
mmetsp:Transcript_3494/g.10809  ORF Transcript_3494/g.10809 Transcript_3494/m.10809 type:complete len:451 (-) Transcript_3494:1190-2542(-)